MQFKSQQISSYPLKEFSSVYDLWTTPQHPDLQFFKLTPAAFEPQWGTAYAACFDLRACLELGSTVKMYDLHNVKSEITVEVTQDGPYISIAYGSRVMVPTGLILDIPVGYSVRLHSRSGIAVKQGLVLANHEGVIDADYVDPTYIVLRNDSAAVSYIFHGDRIAQGEMIPDIAYNVKETTTKPAQKTDRVGGFGSTGTN